MTDFFINIILPPCFRYGSAHAAELSVSYKQNKWMTCDVQTATTGRSGRAPLIVHSVTDIDITAPWWSIHLFVDSLDSREFRVRKQLKCSRTC